MSNFVKLIDNSSEELHLVSCLRRLITSGNYRHIKIATGYWDLPGMKLIQDELQTFLAGGGNLYIIIGKEPTLRDYQLRSDLTKEEKFPDFVAEGYTIDDVKAFCGEYELVCTYTEEETEVYAEGKITYQSRKADMVVAKGSNLTVRYAVKPKPKPSTDPKKEEEKTE